MSKPNNPFVDASRGVDFSGVEKYTKGDGAVQECRECALEFPLTLDHWHRDAAERTGFRTICKACRKKKIETARDTTIIDAVGRLDTRIVESLAATPTDKFSRIPHSAEIFESIMELFGGPKGFAMHYMATFASSKPGSSIRQKMLRDMLLLSNKVTEMGASTKDLRELSQEELEHEMTEVISIAMNTVEVADIYNGEDRETA